MFDVILKGGWVIDGAGGPPFRADVGLLDFMIAAVGRLDEATAPLILDVSERYVAPGFIDAHVHGDLSLLADPHGVGLAALKQGITTFVIGQDGTSVAPGRPETIAFLRRYAAGFNGDPASVPTTWESVADYLARFDRSTPLNVAYLIPNGNLRLDAIGHDPRPASDEDLAAMVRAVREGMEAGAVGVSSGLDYLPSKYADARELAALAREAARFDGIYVTHMRGYGHLAARGVAEVVEIARRSGAACHISHYNGPAELLLPLIDSARASGLDLTFDTYPYEAGSTILSMVALPEESQAGGIEATLERLADPTHRDDLRRTWFSPENATRRTFPLEGIRLAMVDHPDWCWAEGLTLADAAAQAGLDLADLVCELLVVTQLAVGTVVFAGDRAEADIRAILRHPAHMAGSDGIYLGGRPHPRGFGAFARYLGRHTRTLGDYSWGEAVVHLASHAARRHRLTDRGLLRPGYAADIVVFDPHAVNDRADYADGKRLAEGVDHVFVNGILALQDGRPTGATPGRALRRG